MCKYFANFRKNSGLGKQYRKNRTIRWTKKETKTKPFTLEPHKTANWRLAMLRTWLGFSRWRETPGTLETPETLETIETSKTLWADIVCVRWLQKVKELVCKNNACVGRVSIPMESFRMINLGYWRFILCENYFSMCVIILIFVEINKCNERIDTQQWHYQKLHHISWERVL